MIKKYAKMMVLALCLTSLIPISLLSQEKKPDNPDTFFKKHVNILLFDLDPEKRSKAVLFLAKKRVKRALPHFIAALEADPSEKVRACAAQALVWMKAQSPEAIATLGKAIRKDKSFKVRRMCVAALWDLNVRTPAAFSSVLIALQDGHEAVRAESAIALGRLKVPNASALLRYTFANDRSPTVRATAITVLVYLGEHKRDNFVYILLRGLKDKGAPVRATSARCFIYVNRKLFYKVGGFEQVVRALHDSEATVRSAAGFALADIGDPRAFKLLLPLLNDPEWYVRANAARWLPFRRDKRAIQPLINRLRIETHKVVQSEIGRGLAVYGSSLYNPMLKDLGKPEYNEKFKRAVLVFRYVGKPFLFRLDRRLRYKDIQVRKNTIYYAGKIRHDYLLPSLERILKFGKDKSERGLAAWAMSQIGGTRVLNQALYIGGSKGWPVETRDLALWILGELKNPTAVLNLMDVIQFEKNDTLRERATWALINIGVKALPSLLEILRFKATSLSRKEIVVSVIAEIKDPVSVDIMISVLNSKEPWISDRAVKALGKFGNPKAIDPLIQLYNKSSEKERKSLIRWALTAIRYEITQWNTLKNPTDSLKKALEKIDAVLNGPKPTFNRKKAKLY